MSVSALVKLNPQNQRASANRASRAMSASQEVQDGSLLAYLLGRSSCGSYHTEPKVIHVKRCELCGVWSSDSICACLKMLPASSLDDPRGIEDDPWQDTGGEG